jgi:hypothetical protein
MSEFPGVPLHLPDHSEWIKRAARMLNNLLIGKMNVSDLVTLRENETTTTIQDSRLGVETAVLLVPTTANAAGALATTSVSETGRVNGSVVITHANAATTDRTFRFVLIG